MITPCPYQMHTSKAGDLAVVHFKALPFKVKRAFWINEVPKGAWRGGHAHKQCHQMLYAVSGLITVTGNDGTHFIENTTGLHIPPMTWVDICFRSSGGCLLVLASHDYDESDYIRSYEDYLALLNPVQ